MREIWEKYRRNIVKYGRNMVKYRRNMGQIWEKHGTNMGEI